MYLIESSCVINSANRTFSDLLFFSIQTQATIGYGYLAPSPACVWTNIVVGFQCVFSIISVAAIMTGIVFSKFTRPSERIVFSSKLVVQEEAGRKWLMFRLANMHFTESFANECRLDYSENSETTSNRRVYELQLVKSRLEMMQFGWLALHEIDEKSPLYGVAAVSAKQRYATFQCIFSCYDPRAGLQIWARKVWRASDVVWNARFAELRSSTNFGTVFDFSKFSEVVLN